MSIVATQAGNTTTRIMTQVMLALLPGTAIMTWYLGAGVLINILVIVLTAVACEALVLTLRKRAVRNTVYDGSIVLAAWLLALCLPPSLPVSQLIIGGIAMTLLGKHLYGGLGQNPFNPAMVGYALLLISFPQSMTLWLVTDAIPQLPNSSNAMTWWLVKWQPSIVADSWDSIAQATPLDRLRQSTPISNQGSHTVNSEVFAASAWWKINFAWLLGGTYLLWQRTIRWHIPLSLLGTLFLLHFGYQLWNPTEALPTAWAMVSGGALFGAFFIATDPVTAPSSRTARLCYGAGIGLIIFILRTSSNYPEGVAFAVLLMNACVPLLDRMLVRDNWA